MAISIEPFGTLIGDRW